jgi:hypothetical protein
MAQHECNTSGIIAAAAGSYADGMHAGLVDDSAAQTWTYVRSLPPSGRFKVLCH